MDVPEPESHTDGKLSRPYACTYAPCHKSFSRRSDLVRHVRIHTNERIGSTDKHVVHAYRPYKCEFKSCGKCFIQSKLRCAILRPRAPPTGKLIASLFRAARARDPMCVSSVAEAFSDSSSLARHRRVHTGKRPYRCPFLGCDKTFCRKTTLMKHHKSHSDDSLSFHSDSGSPKSASALQSTSTSPSCVTSFHPQFAHSTYLDRIPQNMSAPASTQTFPHLPHPSSYAPPWSSTSATFSLASPSQSDTSLATSTSFPMSMQSHNFLLPVISPQPTSMNCRPFFGRHLSQSQPFPQIDRTHYNHMEPYSATTQYVPDTQELYRPMPKPRDGGAPETQLSNVLDHSSFFGPLDMSNQLLVEPLQGNQAIYYTIPFPINSPMSMEHSPGWRCRIAYTGLAISSNPTARYNNQHR
ncbi:hypothetical protein PSHT_02954 [Puccinia striiformis]|uniref:C2H2-type domain-containing protein n=1 Tax=Puccinia striiformis TaxID=27350 RepID=A0A2S4WGQ8_9BASI|nr:hypothetical protein PSHT_02954 [Puccinia striiformis]